jgi:hypothetical protein
VLATTMIRSEDDLATELRVLLNPARDKQDDDARWEVSRREVGQVLAQHQLASKNGPRVHRVVNAPPTRTTHTGDDPGAAPGVSVQCQRDSEQPG